MSTTTILPPASTPSGMPAEIYAEVYANAVAMYDVWKVSDKVMTMSDRTLVGTITHSGYVLTISADLKNGVLGQGRIDVRDTSHDMTFQWWQVQVGIACTLAAGALLVGVVQVGITMLKK